MERHNSKTVNKITPDGSWLKKKREGESVDTIVNRLMILAKDCSFANVTAIKYKKESVLQSFISGLEDPYIRQRILKKGVNLEGALGAAEILKRPKTDRVIMKQREIKRLFPWLIILNQNVI